MSWINHLPPACWSTFRKSNSKQQLGCRFDIMDYESYFFVFWHMQLYMSWYIISFFGFTFLNIFIFSSTLVLTFSYRRNLYTFYSSIRRLCHTQRFWYALRYTDQCILGYTLFIYIYIYIHIYIYIYMANGVCDAFGYLCHLHMARRIKLALTVWCGNMRYGFLSSQPNVYTKLISPCETYMRQWIQSALV